MFGSTKGKARAIFIQLADLSNLEAGGSGGKCGLQPGLESWFLHQLLLNLSELQIHPPQTEEITTICLDRVVVKSK